MKFQEAIETGLPLRRKNKQSWKHHDRYGIGHISTCYSNTLGGTYIARDYFLETIQMTAEDILADDWEVQQPKVEITREEFWKLFAEAHQEVLGDPQPDFAQTTWGFYVSYPDAVKRLADKIFGEQK